MTSIYRGFSTRDFFNTKSFLYSDIDVVNNDLWNHINTTIGEVPHDPTFGTRIHLMTFEGLTPELVAMVKEDIAKIVANDPRVQLRDSAVLAVPNTNSLIVVVDLYYLYLDTNASLQFQI